MKTFNQLWYAYLNPTVSMKDSFFFELKKFDLIATLSCVCLYKTSNKYKSFQNVLQNPFLNPAEKENFMHVFGLIQRRYFALSRFAYLWKWKRATPAIDTDLFLNTIDLEKRNSFVLYRGKNKFHFIISDLMRLMELAIWHNWEGSFRVISQIPSNPYTKQDFRQVDLYNIYYHMKWNMDIIIPQFFQLWFLEDFCFDSFKRRNDQYIRKLCIRQFTRTVSNQMIYKNVKEMLSEYDFTCKWRIHENFPKDVLVDVMRPYLYVHYLITFDIVSCRQASYYEVVLHLQLKRFYAFNKLFGQRKFFKTADAIPVPVFKPSDFTVDIPCCCKKQKAIVVPVRKESFHVDNLEFFSWHF